MEDTSWVKKKIIRWMEDNRGLILTLFGLPLSFIFDLVMQVICRLTIKIEEEIISFSSETGPTECSFRAHLDTGKGWQPFRLRYDIAVTFYLFTFPLIGDIR